ncbi:molybdopterin oxidoreductase [Citricoccus zhacaiensis]|uniref:Molybdopterin oxidoreductase n=1 Tax=Citricoccus zhacaiensis TaxID=489142 RepID=A0ABQ2M119_9MICC|nr:molybdopterin oxidoreductase family protein [Citricoccus zhacaiensis]GGO45875.1 molybdopterin oxidoreductase [Citricoccus zhacaiensis]
MSELATPAPISAPTPAATATRTHCPYCALQCAMTLTLEPSPATSPSTNPVTVTGAEFPTNRGRLCRKGATSAALLGDRPDRLTTPLIRDGASLGRANRDSAPLREATWDEALDLVASRITALQQSHGRDAIGVFGSGSLTNEKAYTLGKFARTALRTSRIDYNGRFCMASAAKAATEVLGLDRGLPFPLTDLDAACTVLLLGSNVADTMPPFVQHLERARSHGGLIVVDPRRSATAQLTGDGAGHHLAPAPGGDLPLLLSVAHVLLAEGLADEDYLSRRTTGLASFRRSVADWWPERSQSVSGISAGRIRWLARHLAAAARASKAGGDPVFILTGRGVEQHRDGTDTAKAAISLALLLGLPGTRHGGYGTLTGQGNGQGGREMGQKADQLPGLRSITDPADREATARHWGIPADALPGPGLPATQLLHTLGTEHGVKALLVHGANVAVSAPDVQHVEEGLRALDLLVVCDFFRSETAEFADVVLPVLQWAEEDGTLTNLEGRLLRRSRAVDGPRGARSELWILAELARRLGSTVPLVSEPAEVFEEIRRVTAGARADYAGVAWDRLGEVAAYWPLDEHAPGTHPGPPEITVSGEPVIGTPRVFTESFGHPDGRAHLGPIHVRDPQPPSAQGLTLTTGRLMEHYQSGAQTRRVPDLLGMHPEATVSVHPATAVGLRLVEGAHAELRSTSGSMQARVVFDSGLRTDTVFVPFHFAGRGAANRLTAGLLDPLSQMPEFKNTPVTLHPAPSVDGARS